MHLDEEIRVAVRGSCFGGLPDDAVRALFENAACYELPVGSELAPIHRRTTTFFLIVSGLVKVYITSPSGRRATIRYARAGALLGSPSLFHPPVPGVGVRTVTTARLVAFDVPTVRRAAETDVRVAHALNVEMAQRIHGYFEELAGTSFASLRERVIQHLLDVASEQPRGPALVARLSQQEVAEAVGSVREAVGRVLGQLRDDGLVRTAKGEIELLDPVRLAAQGWIRDKSHANL